MSIKTPMTVVPSGDGNGMRISDANGRLIALGMTEEEAREIARALTAHERLVELCRTRVDAEHERGNPDDAALLSALLAEATGGKG